MREFRETVERQFVMETLEEFGPDAGAESELGRARELVEQAKTQKLSIGHVILATGSAGTQAGLLVGLGCWGGCVQESLAGVHILLKKNLLKRRKNRRFTGQRRNM